MNLEVSEYKMGEYFTTNKGKPLLFFENYYYVHHKVTYWRCRQYASGCKGRVKVVGDIIMELKAHDDDHQASARSTIVTEINH